MRYLRQALAVGAARPGPARLLLLFLLLLATPAAASGRGTELGASIGVLATALLHDGGASTEPFALFALDGRWRPGAPGQAGGGAGWFVADGWALAGPSLQGGAERTSYGFAARAGLSLPYVEALLGPTMHLAPGGPAPLSVLPSATVRAGAGEWRALVGVFDSRGLVPLRVGVEHGAFGAAYVPALGLEAWGRLPLGDGQELYGNVFAYRLFQHLSAAATVGFAWTPSAPRGRAAKGAERPAAGRGGGLR